MGPRAASCRALDIGTGSGCLALMITQQAVHHNRDLTVDAIDVDAATCEVARQNVEASPWPDRINVMTLSLQDLLSSNQHQHDQSSYEIIISNPPYFTASTRPPSERRAAARHQDVALPFEVIADGAARLLSNRPLSALYLVLPTSECDRFCSEAESCGLKLSHIVKIRTIASDATDKRRIMRFARKGDDSLSDSCSCGVVEEELVVSEELFDPELGKRYWVNTQEYDRLTEPFHHPDHIGKKRY